MLIVMIMFILGSFILGKSTFDEVVVLTVKYNKYHTTISSGRGH